jgi:type IV secretory pathway VirB4 component
MTDFSLPARVTLVFGRTEIGKTTFCSRYLANAVTEQDANPEPVACVFIFDWKLEAARRWAYPCLPVQGHLVL